MEKMRIVKISLGVLTALLIVLSISMIYVSVLVVPGSFSNFDDVISEEPRVFKTYQFNPKTNDESSGVAQLISHEDSIFYEGKDGSYHLISSLESEEYKCRGTCSCESVERRSSSAILIKRGIVFLVGAMTSLLAYEKAKEYFHTECERQLLSECSSTTISSSIEGCDPISMLSDAGVIDEDEKTTLDDLEDKEKVFKNKFSYSCSGICLPIDPKYFNKLADELGVEQSRDKVRALKNVLKKCVKSMKCRKLKFSTTIDQDKLNGYIEYLQNDPSIGNINNEMFEKNVDQFTTIYFSMIMDDFCERAGKVPVPGINPDEISNKKPKTEEAGKMEKTGLPFCEAWKGCISERTSFQEQLNPTIECIRDIPGH